MQGLANLSTRNKLFYNCLPGMLKMPLVLHDPVCLETLSNFT